MKVIRKTNLFNEYGAPTDGMPDLKRKSLFLPFSNYGESMTGNHLSVDAKLYPSAFICFYIKAYDPSSFSTGKPKDVNYFIKKMTRLYENKMAFARDAAISGEFTGLGLNSVEPLPYLLHYMQKNEECSIVYVGRIAEQDYDGVYSDMMLTIEAGMSPRKYKLDCIDATPNIGTWTGRKVIDYPFYDSKSKNYLYGWYYLNNASTPAPVYTGPSVYENETPGLDIGGPDNTGAAANQYIYNVSEYFTGISCEYDPNPSDTLKFNFVVPLYDVFIDDVSSANSGTQNASWINDTVPSATSGAVKTIDFSIIKNEIKNRSLYDTLVPYGIWWSGYTPVTLDRSNGENPQWTLTLSQQFKPFPYSWNKLDANDTRGNLYYGTDKEYSTPLHDTFAQILSRQNNAIDKIMEQDKNIADLRNEIETLKALVNSK